MSLSLIPLVSPGEVLLEEFLKPNNIKQKTLADAIGLPPSRVSEIIKGRHRINGEIAIALSSYFGTSPEFWINLQALYDYEKADREEGERIRSRVTPFRVGASTPLKIAASKGSPAIRKGGGLKGKKVRTIIKRSSSRPSSRTK